MIAPAHPPQHHHHHHYHRHAPSPSPILPIINNSSPPAVDFSPPLIAMVVVIAAAFIFVTYSRLLTRHLRPPLQRLLHHFRRRRFLPPSSSIGDIESLQYESTLETLHVFSPYGLDESVIKTIPFSLYTAKYEQEFESRRDCAVCLLEFEDDDYVRTLPVCSHTFHVDCIDAWLRSHANCPLCRSGVLCFESPFTPLMAARIRPSFDMLTSLDNTPFRSIVPEITPCVDENENSNSPGRMNSVAFSDRFNGGDFLLKRSYSFGYERSLPSERMVIDAATASPWRYRRGSTTGFWTKRPSPFGSLGKSRVFSFRYYRGMKSPFFRRRSFFPLSESSGRYGGGGGGSSSRRSKSIASPMFLRSSVTAATFSSSRLRCGDPEALLSPERYNRR